MQNGSTLLLSSHHKPTLSKEDIIKSSKILTSTSGPMSKAPKHEASERLKTMTQQLAQTSQYDIISTAPKKKSLSSLKQSGRNSVGLTTASKQSFNSHSPSNVMRK